MKRPFANIGFSMAITLIILNLLPYSYILPITIGLAVVFIASLALSKYRQAITVPLCLGTALFACLLFVLVYESTVLPQLALNGKTANATFYIIDIPEKTETGYNYIIKVTDLLSNGAPQNIKMKLKTDFIIDAKPYQLLNANLDLYSVGTNAFSSYGYWGDNIFISAKTDIVTSTNQYINGPATWIYALRKGAIDVLSSNLSGDEGAISIALVTGYRSLISNKLQNAFFYAGASHIMAISGFHLVMIVGAFAFLLKKLRVNEQTSAILTIFLLIAFVGFTGYAKSTVRAGIMMFVLLLGKLFNRRADTLNSLGLAVFVLCFNPFAVTDIGMQLSVVSTLSLILILSVVFAKPMNIFVKRIARVTAVPISVLIFSAPIMYLFYGKITISTLFSNVFVSLIGSISLVMSVVSLLAFKIGFLPTFFTGLITLANKVFIKIIYAFSSLNLLTIDLTSVFGIALAGVLVIFAFVYFSGNLKMLKLATVSSTLIILVVTIVSTIISYNSAFVMVSKSGSIAMKYRDKTVIYCLSNECDFDDFSSFINSNSKSVDYIVAEHYDENVVSYVKEYGCKNFVIKDNTNDLSLISYCDNIENATLYSVNDNGIEIKTLKNDEMSYCLLGVNNVTIVDGKNISSNCDIKITNGYIKDCNGKIDLSDGNVIYTINNNNYKARRVDAWLK